MKRYLLLLLVVLGLSGCAVEPEYHDPRVTVDKLPYTMVYNDTELAINSVELYQGYSQETYQWTLYAIIHVDISNCTDAQVHYLTVVDDPFHTIDGPDLNIDVYCGSEQNDIGFPTHMSLIKKYRDTSSNELVYLYCDIRDFARNDFSDVHFSSTFTVKQEEKYTDTTRSKP